MVRLGAPAGTALTRWRASARASTLCFPPAPLPCSRLQRASRSPGTVPAVPEWRAGPPVVLHDAWRFSSVQDGPAGGGAVQGGPLAPFPLEGSSGRTTLDLVGPAAWLTHQGVHNRGARQPCAASPRAMSSYPAATAHPRSWSSFTLVPQAKPRKQLSNRWHLTSRLLSSVTCSQVRRGPEVPCCRCPCPA